MDPAFLASAGWTKLPTNEFTTLVGPFWTRGGGADREIGFIAEPKHQNHLRTVNGGMLVTFADTSLGCGVVDALGGHLGCATAQLQVQFVSTAAIGGFVTCRPELVCRTAKLVFMRGLIMAGEKTVASADGIWKVLEARAP
jgi:acyl-coenzyme A thioesterase PaaI-like protein